MGTKKKIALMLAALAALAASMPLVVPANSSPAGGFLDSLTNTSDSRTVSRRNAGGADLEVIGADHLAPDVFSNEGGTCYVGYVPPTQAVTRQAASGDWRTYE
jgi:hypothetical protein